MTDERIPTVSVEETKSKVDVQSINELERLIKLGTVEMDAEIGGIQIKMHSLKESEKILALNLIKTNEGTTVANIELSKAAFLTYSITSMGSQQFLTADEKIELFRKLHIECQSTILDTLYDKYNEMVIKQFEILENLKKK